LKEKLANRAHNLQNGGNTTRALKQFIESTDNPYIHDDLKSWLEVVECEFISTGKILVEVISKLLDQKYEVACTIELNPEQ